MMEKYFLLFVFYEPGNSMLIKLPLRRTLQRSVLFGTGSKLQNCLLIPTVQMIKGIRLRLVCWLNKDAMKYKVCIKLIITSLTQPLCHRQA